MPAAAGPEVYLDAAAAVPVHPVARAALLAALDDGWADPSRLYRSGRRARLLLDGARESLAASLGARTEEIHFLPSGSAAVAAGVAGVLAGRRRSGAHVVHSAIEHSSLLASVADGPATAVPVDRVGRVDPQGFEAALRSDTAVACLISASHEVATVQPVAAVAAACRERGVPLLLDAAATVGRAPVPPGWSLLAASAHKWGGPPGVGVLAVRAGTRFVPPPVAGPLDLPAVLAAAVSLEAACAEAAAEDARLRPLVDRIRQVASGIPDVEVVGDPVDRLPHLVTFSVLYLDGEVLVTALDRLGFAVSSGSACSSEVLRPSHVLAAMGVLTHGNLRVSLHRGTTEADVDRFLAVLPPLVAELRATAGVSGL